ncbi:MAG: helix-turn-helix domain-containing protein [Bacteroidetes bacterium]|nr:helix-turn-helix domain-containing protein [Bacteroidota bacterium]
MAFDFNQYSTPLLFAFVQAWIYAGLFWWRGWRNERLSDWLLGCLLVALAFEIWEYMLGFAGIEILWNELEFFPRNFGLLLPALAWFYLRSQFDYGFRFRRKDLWHATPFLLIAGYHLLVFAQGPDFVANWKETIHERYGIEFVELGLKFVLNVVYFVKAYRLYQRYRQWAPNEFSNVEEVSFRWFRNFLLAFMAAYIISWGMLLFDLWLDLDFWHDWWDELFNAALIYYLCIAGYAQTQPRKLHFSPAKTNAPPIAPTPKTDKLADEDLEKWRTSLEKIMTEERLYLEPDLTLSDLARRLDTNPSVLSAVVNRIFEKNFNDFVNEYRVEAVKRLLNDPAVSHLSLLGIGLECGFNSKSTFNRAFRKATGMAPGEWTNQAIDSKT